MKIMNVDANNILARIDETLTVRKGADPRSSYVASLYQAGMPAVLKKVREEAEEVVMAGAESDEHLIYEVADLLFHCQVLLAYRGLKMQSILEELVRRFGTSGHVHKESQSNQSK